MFNVNHAYLTVKSLGFSNDSTDKVESGVVMTRNTEFISMEKSMVEGRSAWHLELWELP